MQILAKASALLFLGPMDERFEARKKKKVDMEALQSPLKRIPGMDLPSVRDLMDIGIQDIDELRGRAPEALFEEILNLREQTPRDRLHFIRMAVYYAETNEPDPALMQAWKWTDTSLLG
ncbi:MAG TPA: helix-hairpin-helix domain-containing protein [Oceanipulchritudo sp.]|nr:helix-hairpin-helix domain-containing protein [Oceanipulchritudo sp.]